MNTTKRDDNPLVSIVVPSFNQGDFIAETIDSILAQTYRPIEVIVIDGASNDNTVEILRGYGDRITWISEPDEGHHDGLNKGFRMARGEIVGWLNSDDVYFKRTSVEHMVIAFHQDSDIDVLYGDAAIIAEDNTLLRFYHVLPYNRKRILRRNTICQPTVFFRQHVVKNEGCRLPLGLDYEYWLRLGAKGYRFRHVNLLVAADRNHRKRFSVSRKREMDEIVAEFTSQYMEDVPNYKSCWLDYWDSFCQAFCRLKGVWVVLSLMANPGYLGQLAFPVKLDTTWKLLYRQTMKSSNKVF